MKKHLKIFPEYDCSPLWVSNNGSIYENYIIDKSIFNEALKTSLFEWNWSFQKTLNQNYPPDSGFLTVKEKLNFEKNGLIIWDSIVHSYSYIYNEVSYYSIALNELFYSREQYSKEMYIRYNLK